jgi:hypothetical protein
LASKGRRPAYPGELLRARRARLSHQPTAAAATAASSGGKEKIAYRKAVGRPEGVAELCIFYCEEAARLVGDCGIEDEVYYSALVRMFEQGVTQAFELPDVERDRMVRRLDAIRASLRGIGWGISDAVNEIWHDRVD